MKVEYIEYFRIRYLEKVTDYKKIYELELKEKVFEEIKDENIAREKYKKIGGIDKYILDRINNKLGLNLNGLEEIKDYFEEYHTIYKYYNEERKELFSDHVELLNWWKEQENKCQYCGITQNELYKIAELRGELIKKEEGKEGNNLTINGKTKRSIGTLEIERKDCTKSYTYKNCILACPLCNNAKSNLIDEEGWKDFFAVPMKKYYDELLKPNLKYYNTKCSE